MKFLILFILFSTSVFSNYMSKPDMESCSPGRTVYMAHSRCQEVEGESCHKVPDGYNCNYHKVTTENENDLNLPIYSKNEIEACSTEPVCDAKHIIKVCTDPDEMAIKNYDSMEVYCTKIVNYQQKSVTRAREDSGLKTPYDANMVISNSEKSAIGLRLDDMDFGRKIYASVQVLNESKGLSKGQRRTLRADLEVIRDDLMDGNICDARFDIAALTTDPIVIRDEDVTAVLAKLDAYKTCP